MSCSGCSVSRETSRFYIDNVRMDLMLTTLHRAVRERQGLFHHGLEALLPQYNMPIGLGLDPVTKTCADPKASARYLWLRIQCDRRDPSYMVNAKMKRAWSLPQTRFLFDYEEVVKRSPQEISELFVKHIRYTFLEKDGNRPDELHLTGKTLIENAQLMLDRYDGDPRNIIHDRDTHEAWELLQDFKYWGEGLASLYLAEMMDLGIVTPRNPEKFMPKIDIHKPRIAFNVDAAQMKRAANGAPLHTEVYHASLIQNIAPAYRDAAQRVGVNMVEVDGAIWALGANVCMRDDYRRCQLLCPLVDQCKGNAKEGRRQKSGHNPDRKNRSSGTLVIYNENGTRVDNRKHANHIADLFPHIHNLKSEPVIEEKKPDIQLKTEQMELFNTPHMR